MSVRIDRVVTRGGDKGQTSLGDGTRLPKNSSHVEAIGALDETNATLGVLRCHVQAVDADLAVRLADIQNLLFDMGGDLCMPEGSAHAKRVEPAVIVTLEAEIERLRALQSPLTSFVLPGGSLPAAWAHMTRTSVRQAERAVVALSADTPINPTLVPLLNRLSDYFFVLARHLNANGQEDVVWQPGRGLFHQG